MSTENPITPLVDTMLAGLASSILSTPLTSTPRPAMYRRTGKITNQKAEPGQVRCSQCKKIRPNKGKILVRRHGYAHRDPICAECK